MVDLSDWELTERGLVLTHKYTKQNKWVQLDPLEDPLWILLRVKLDPLQLDPLV